MQPTTVTNKNIANGVPKKRAGKSDDDGSAPDSPLELQNLLQALRAMRAGDFSVRMTGEEDGLLPWRLHEGDLDLAEPLALRDHAVSLPETCSSRVTGR